MLHDFRFPNGKTDVAYNLPMILRVIIKITFTPNYLGSEFRYTQPSIKQEILFTGKYYQIIIQLTLVVGRRWKIYFSKLITKHSYPSDH